MHTVFLAEFKLAIGDLHGDGDEDGVRGDAEVVERIIDVDLAAKHASGDVGIHFLVVGSALDIGVQIEGFEFILGGGAGAESDRQRGAMGIGKALGF